MDRETVERAEFILERLGLTWENLRGKLVLEIGAGSAEVSEVARKKGLSVVPLDPYPLLSPVVNAHGKALWILLQSGITWESLLAEMRLLEKSSESRRLARLGYVQGDVRALPFQDHVFDLVISHAGPLNNGWSLLPEQAACGIHECLRVLKTGGELRTVPIFREDPHPTLLAYDKVGREYTLYGWKGSPLAAEHYLRMVKV